MTKDEEMHRAYFKENWQVLFVLDTVDKLDTFYVYDEEGKGLRQARGYFIYYDKNREMQEYMLENSLVRPKVEETKKVAESGSTPAQQERMDAAQEIRRVLQKRERIVKKAKKEHDRMLVLVSCVLCIVCITLGIAMMQSLNRLRTVETELVAMQSTYQALAEDFEGVKTQSVFALQQKPGDVEEADKNETKKYVVEGGDSLGYISRKFYGDNSGVDQIMEMNGLVDADMIYAGQVLWIPGI